MPTPRVYMLVALLKPELNDRKAQPRMAFNGRLNNQPTMAPPMAAIGWQIQGRAVRNPAGTLADNGIKTRSNPICQGADQKAHPTQPPATSNANRARRPLI